MNSLQVVHNYLRSVTGGNYAFSDAEKLAAFYEFSEKNKEFKKFKVALLFVCINQPYWQYAKDVIEGAKKFFLPGHEVEYFLWTDMTPGIRENLGVNVFEVGSIEWPFPTLYRYHLFLQQEELLKKFDYVFYCDIDMRFVNIVGDEIFGAGLTAAQHPGYALKQAFWIPYEPNPKSTAYIPRPGVTIFDQETKQNKMMPLFFAGGFQGGTSEKFIEAMKVMRKNIDKDLTIQYFPLWNEQAHWNRYLFDNPPSVVLSPSYIFPDSLIKEYYEPIWGCIYPPKIVTLTKKFSVKPLSEKEVKDLHVTGNIGQIESTGSNKNLSIL